MDKEWQEDILEKFNAAQAEGALDINDSNSVDKFLSRVISEHSVIESYDGGIDEKMLALYEEQEELKLKIRKEKQAGKYSTFHKMLLTGELQASNPFVLDILCMKTVKNDREKIKICDECLFPERCPRRSEIERREKNKFYGKTNQELKKRKEILDTFNAIYTNGVSYASAKSDTLKKRQISGRTFDKYYRTRKMDPLTALRLLLK